MNIESCAEIPIFPLRTVIMPGGILPLRIFEPRYVDMIGRCLKGEMGFGICAIRESRSGGETSTQAVTDIFEVGTRVKIIDFEALAGGLLGITVTGEYKFRILDAWQQEDQLGVAQVEYLPLEKKVRLTAENNLLGELLQRIMPDVEEYYGKEHLRHLESNYQDALWVGSRLVEFLPINIDVKQMLLECDDPLERLLLLQDAVHQVET